MGLEQGRALLFGAIQVVVQHVLLLFSCGVDMLRSCVLRMQCFNEHQEQLTLVQLYLLLLVLLLIVALCLILPILCILEVLASLRAPTMREPTPPC